MIWLRPAQHFCPISFIQPVRIPCSVLREINRVKLCAVCSLCVFLCHWSFCSVNTAYVSSSSAWAGTNPASRAISLTLVAKPASCSLDKSNRYLTHTNAHICENQTRTVSNILLYFTLPCENVCLGLTWRARRSGRRQEQRSASGTSPNGAPCWKHLEQSISTGERELQIYSQS